VRKQVFLIPLFEGTEKKEKIPSDMCERSKSSFDRGVGDMCFRGLLKKEAGPSKVLSLARDHYEKGLYGLNRPIKKRIYGDIEDVRE
jgi:hypothetical protein